MRIVTLEIEFSEMALMAADKCAVDKTAVVKDGGPSVVVRARHLLDPGSSFGKATRMRRTTLVQASSLESLLRHFRTYGMNDLEFMIVNSNLPHSQAVLHELTSRVTFPVYQDTEEKNIWEMMQGGKDDIYVYDRLAYYIPFPLSIMNTDEALVVSAILATYYRSPCGVTCDKNNNSSLEDILNAKATTEEDLIPPTETEFSVEYSTPFYQTEDPNISISNETIGNENNESIPIINDIYKMNDLVDLLYNDTYEFPENGTINKETDEFYNSILFLFNQTSTNNITEESDIFLSNSSSVNTFSNNNINDNTTDVDDFHQHHHHQHNSNDTQIVPKKESVPEQPKRKSDRCIEADISVCRNWNKKRLIKAHNCCSSPEMQSENQNCKNFGKKRCKKLRTILKCCIKTAFIDKVPTTAVDESDATTVTENINTTDVFEEVPVVTNLATEMNERHCLL
ncbi:selP_N domain-containing protein [Caerostris extrusa]|uniref:SelP_N domain-containing protein n=1 Tax=Caerostris extrusa TaxID=172846 RepID=A0AAV4TF09_CAEEX|nr:selP_N domain-containing protein [Caerostris extrusa]